MGRQVGELGLGAEQAVPGEFDDQGERQPGVAVAGGAFDTLGTHLGGPGGGTGDGEKSGPGLSASGPCQAGDAGPPGGVFGENSGGDRLVGNVADDAPNVTRGQVVQELTAQLTQVRSPVDDARQPRPSAVENEADP